MISRTLLFATAVLVLALSGCGKSAPHATPDPAPVDTATPLPPTVTAVPALPRHPPPTPPPPEGNRIRIPKLGVDAALTLSVVEPSGRLDDPKGPDDVSVYDFSKFPALGGWFDHGNVVMAGYADSDKPCDAGRRPPPCVAVFGGLFFLLPGDEVQVWWEKQEYVYAVVSVCTVDASIDFMPIVKQTDAPAITLITGAGSRDEKLGSTHRLVVRAEQQKGSLSHDCPG